jgi:hypothetical protein
LLGDDVLIIVVDAVLFFQGKDFIVRLGLVGRVLAAVIRSFLLLVVFFPLLLRASQIMVVALLIVSIILVVLVVVILLVVVVMVAVPIIVTSIVGIHSFWIGRVTTFDIWITVELMVGAKGLFIVVSVTIAWVLVSLAALILISGWLLL